MEKIKERASKYEISVHQKSSKYYIARISTNFGGGISKRIEKSAKTRESAVLNLLIELQTYINDLHSNGLLTCKIDSIVSQRLIKSINDLEIFSNDITQKALEIVNMLQTINSQIGNYIYYSSNVVLLNSIPTLVPAPTQFTLPLNSENVIQKSKSKKANIHKIEDVLIEWKNLSLIMPIRTFQSMMIIWK